MTCAGENVLAPVIDDGLRRSQRAGGQPVGVHFRGKGLGVSKAIGDLAGPMAFAILMGSARAFYGKFGDKIDLDKFMVGSGLLCIGSIC